MINWINIEDSIPEADREVIIYNPNSMLRKKSKVCCYGKNFSAEMIYNLIVDDNCTLWCYVE